MTQLILTKRYGKYISLHIATYSLIKFMAANGLMANPNKTAFLLMNNKCKQTKTVKLNIAGHQIENQQSAKLLGMKFEENLKWNEHINGIGGVVSSLNSRLYLIRRLKNQLHLSGLKKVADSLFVSKIRYGLQLLGRVRQSDTETSSGDLHTIQLIQNKLARALNNVKLSDHCTTKSLLTKLNMQSVNQLNAQIKITEIWKAVHKDNYPIEVNKYIIGATERLSRAKTSEKLLMSGHSELVKSTFKNDAIILWNNCPDSITKCTSLFSAKKAIKCYTKCLPI